MQKSKIATICFAILIATYSALSVIILEKTGKIFTNVINPLFWIILAFSIRSLFGKNYENKKFRAQIIEYTLIACLIYVITYLISGLFVTFGKNPYSRTLIGIIKNLWIFGSVLIAREYIRYRLINNVFEKDKKLIVIIVTILFTLIDFRIWNMIGTKITIYIIIAVAFEKLIPILSKNILYSYLAVNNNYTSSVIYEFLTNLYLWLSPILPNTPWIMETIIDTTIPVILLLYIRYTKNKLDKFKTRQKLLNSDPRNIVPLVVIIILAIWFAIGVFPIKPVAIASGSMVPSLYIGDISVIKKCGPSDVNVGDIIEYQMDGYTVIHRIAEKKQKKGEFYFTTKGDNNSQPDNAEVTEKQLIGKVIFKIRYLGYPAIWLHLIQEQEKLEIET